MSEDFLGNLLGPDPGWERARALDEMAAVQENLNGMAIRAAAARAARLLRPLPVRAWLRIWTGRRY